MSTQTSKSDSIFEQDDFQYTPSQASNISTGSKPNKKRTLSATSNSPNSENSPNSNLGRPVKKHSRVVSTTSLSPSESTTPYQSPSKMMDLSEDKNGEETLLPETLEEFDALPSNVREVLFKAMKKLEKKISVLEIKVEKLEQQTTVQVGNLQIKKNSNELKEKAKLFAQMSEYKAEKRAKKEKENNLVLYGLPEHEGKDSKDHDKQILQELLKMSEISAPFDDSIAEFFRMGKQGKTIQKNGQEIKCPRLLKLKLKSFNTKKRLLKAQRQAFEKVPELHGQPFSQYFREDLTFLERIYYGDLVEERNRKNASLKPGDGRWKIINSRVLVQDNRKQEN